MARQPRIDLPLIPQHIIQRGNNRQPCFFSDEDRHLYLYWLRRAAKDYGGRIHAYVLMTNHAHLLVTGREKGALGRMMQSLGRRYVCYVNSCYGRTGSLWEGRFRSSLIDSDKYLLTCYRYIELNPVRAGLVEAADAYRWSSHLANAWGKYDPLITPHETYLSLGESAEVRLRAYRKLFQSDIENDDIEAIRRHTNQGKVLGSDDFKSTIEATLQRRVGLAGPGRPKKKVL